MRHLNPLVVRLDSHLPLAAGQVGGKAAALNRLLRHGFPTPPGVCITTAAFRLAFAPHLPEIRAFLHKGNLDDLDGVAAVSEEINALLAAWSLPPDISKPLFNALKQIAAADTLLAVRSSAIFEDGAVHSFAGQYATVLGVRGQAEVKEAVLSCWRSFYSPQALLERSRAAAPDQEDGMAVLIQPLIEAECAGVCFTVDPVAQKRERILVNSAWGLGAGVVDGSVASDIDWLYRKNFAIEKRHIVEKKSQIQLHSSGRPRIIPVPQVYSRAACLPDTWLKRIAHFAIALENLFWSAQDVEWAVADGQVWILQSRPITAIPPELSAVPPYPVEWEEGEELHAWMPGYFRSYQSDPPLPLEYDYFELLQSTYEETCRFMGVERYAIMKQINGRPYSRPEPMGWSDAERRVRHQALEEWRDRLFDEGRTPWEVWGPEVEAALARLRAFNLEQADGEALALHLQEAMAVQKRHFFIHPLCDWRPRRAYFEAYTAVCGESGDEAELAAMQLLEGAENPLTRLVDALYELAAGARGNSHLEALLRDPGSDCLAQLEGMAADTAVTDFRRRLDELLAVYGERHGHGYGSHSTIDTPTWREQPDQLLKLAAGFLNRKVEPPAMARARTRQKRDERMEALLAACDDTDAVAEFRRLLANGRRWWPVLEIHNHYIDQMTTGLLRHAVLAAADWLVRGHILVEAGDVFWLTFEEIQQALNEPVPSDLASSIHRRKVEHAAWAELVPPPLLGLPDPHLEERPPLSDDVVLEPSAEDEGIVRGLGAAPGQAEGRARVAGDSNNLPELEPGDVLVAENMGPRWTPLIPMLGGLVLNSGSIGQHAAVTAREYGIPAVIGTGDATRRIPDKDWVHINGSKGVVTTSPAA
jgi:phosphohistidine swiveling domain-containing protein